jgi:hypothetical protein
VSLPHGSFLDKATSIAPLAIFIPWIWMAIRTGNCLRFLTGGKIPITKRTIWLLKILAIILGAGGAAGLASPLELPWYFALLLSGMVIFFAFTEQVREIIPSKPVQDPAVYRASWGLYWRLRNAYVRSLRLLCVAFLSAALAVALGERMPPVISRVLFGISFAAFVAAFIWLSARQVQFYRWACPRCGCAFNGSVHRPWFLKKCAYCGLPLEVSVEQHDLPRR